jgi:long-chain fatty acid transport protein
MGATGAAFASGFALFEQGAKATAMGGAFAATADDPSAIFYNVAGIAQLRQTQVLAGGTLINFSNSFTGSPNDPLTSGTKGQYRNHTFVPPNAYVVIPFQNNVTFGIGVFSPFGLRTNWDSPWVGRFISTDANVKTVSVQPSVAWRSDDGGINVGLGIEYRRSHIVLARNNGTISPFTGRIVDVANVHLDSDWDSAVGYNVGVLFKSPDNQWRFGASYRSKMSIDYKGDATFTQIPTGNPQLDAVVKSQLPPNQRITTSIDYPSTEIYGLATSAVPNWDIEGDVTHTRWTSFKTLDVAFATTPANDLHRPQNWGNSFSYRLGGNRKVTPRWDVRLGALYDQTPQPTYGVGPLLPDSDRIGATLGVGYHNGPWVVDATEFALHFKKRDTNGTNADGFNGLYKTDANLISINLGYKF